MNIRPISEWTLYRARFAVVYLVLAAIAVALLSIYLHTVPPGLGPSEQQSVVSSGAVSFTQPPNDIVDLPYHALQKLSVQWLGVTPLGVRLPSLTFGALTVLCVVLLLRRWFKLNVAAAAGLIFITSAWFLSFARLGTPAIMVVFWTSVLMLTATYVSQETKAWKWWRVAFAMSAALSLYTPFMTYLFVAVALATIAQPHLRYLLRESSSGNVVIGGFFFVALLVPLGWGIYHNPSVIRDVLAVPSSLPDPIQFGKELLHAASNLINPYNNTTSEIVTPSLGIVTIMLLLIGGARLLRDVHSVRAHLLLIWAAVLVPIVAFNPTRLEALLLPAELVIAIGLNQIIRYWYRLFPRNPYARLFGLIPLTILVFSIVQFNYQRYMLGMLYSEQAGKTFNQSPFLAQAELNKAAKGKPVTLIVDGANKPLYDLMAARAQATTVATGQNLPDRSGTWLVEAGQISNVAATFGPPQKLLVNDHATDALRFAVYQR
jgi:hypothetical protein